MRLNKTKLLFTVLIVLGSCERAKQDFKLDQKLRNNLAGTWLVSSIKLDGGSDTLRDTTFTPSRNNFIQITQCSNQIDNNSISNALIFGDSFDLDVTCINKAERFKKSLVESLLTFWFCQCKNRAPGWLYGSWKIIKFTKDQELVIRTDWELNNVPKSNEIHFVYDK